MVRVLHITPSVRLLGARQSLLTLVAGLAGSRFDPLVLVPAEGDLTVELDKRHIRWVKLRLPPWRKAPSWLSMGRRISQLRALIAAENIGLIHCNEIYPNPHSVTVSAGRGPFPAALSRLARGTAGGLHIPVVTHMRLSVTPRMVRNYFLSDATRIIAVSHGAAADFDAFRWKDEKVRVVYNGIDVERFAQATTQRALIRSQLGFSPNDFIIAQIGLMMPRKRPDFLLEAAPEILRSVPHARFLFVGDASPGQENYLEQLKSRAAQSGLEKCVRFIPFQRNIAPYFGAIDLNMLVSSDEGFGRVIIEAGAAGVPTVGSNVGGIPELIRDGETGFLLGEPNAPDDRFREEMPRFIEIVSDLAHNAERRKAMANAAPALAREIFSAEKYVDGVKHVFQEAVSEFKR